MKKQPKRERRMKCPYCHSFSTKKNGRRELYFVGTDRKTKRLVQRYLCKDCKRSFSKRRDKHKHYSDGFRKELIRMHVEERMSFRVISKRIRERYGIKISPGYLCKMFNDTISRVKGSKQIKEEQEPKWSGYLIIDDKVINVKGRKMISLIAKDKSGDIVHQELFKEVEQHCFDNFIRYIKTELKYNFRGITTDLDKILEKSIKTILGEDFSHQYCLRHAIENIKRILDYQQLKMKVKRLEKEIFDLERGKRIEKMKKYLELKEQLKAIDDMLDAIKKALWSGDISMTDKELRKLERLYNDKYPLVIDFLIKKKKGLLMHQRDKEIPKTNNDAENTNRQIKRRLKTIEAFQRFDYAQNYLILYCNYLRMKPYTDCKGKRKYRNGHTPLELCQANFRVNDWVKFSINLK